LDFSPFEGRISPFEDLDSSALGASTTSGVHVVLLVVTSSSS
jgi:hypothetical protein